MVAISGQVCKEKLVFVIAGANVCRWRVNTLIQLNDRTNAGVSVILVYFDRHRSTDRDRASRFDQNIVAYAEQNVARSRVDRVSGSDQQIFVWRRRIW